MSRKRQANQQKILDDEKKEAKNECFQDNKKYLYNSIGLAFLAACLSVVTPYGIQHLENLIEGVLDYKNYKNVTTKIYLILIDLTVLTSIIMFIIYFIKLFFC